MAKGGQNRKSSQRKIVEGTFRADRNPKNEPDPQPVFELPKPPSHLNKYGKRCWREVGEELVRKRILTLVDLPAFELACMSYGLYRAAHDAVFRPIDETTNRRRQRDLDEYLSGKNSQTIPEYQAMKSSLQQYRALMSDFGLSPSSRNRLDVPEEPDELDPMERLINED